MMANKQYKIKNTNLLHNGTTYKIGDTIELDEKQAKKLEDVLTYISDVKTTATKTTETKTTTKTNAKATTKTTTKAETKNETLADSTQETGEVKNENTAETTDGGNK
jgi:flagellar basal body L-ring protein FlgH